MRRPPPAGTHDGGRFYASPPRGRSVAAPPTASAPAMINARPTRASTGSRSPSTAAPRRTATTGKKSGTRELRVAPTRRTTTKYRTAPGFPETVLCESRGQGRMLHFATARRSRLRGWLSLVPLHRHMGGGPALSTPLDNWTSDRARRSPTKAGTVGTALPSGAAGPRWKSPMPSRHAAFANRRFHSGPSDPTWPPRTNRNAARGAGRGAAGAPDVAIAAQTWHKYCDGATF